MTDHCARCARCGLEFQEGEDKALFIPEAHFSPEQCLARLTAVARAAEAVIKPIETWEERDAAIDALRSALSGQNETIPQPTEERDSQPNKPDAPAVYQSGGQSIDRLTRELAEAREALRWYAAEGEAEEFFIVDAAGERVARFASMSSRARAAISHRRASAMDEQVFSDAEGEALLRSRKAKLALYDRACEDLARHFLGGRAGQATVAALAAHIQVSIEDWIGGHDRAAILAAQQEADDAG